MLVLLLLLTIFSNNVNTENKTYFNSTNQKIVKLDSINDLCTFQKLKFLVSIVNEETKRGKTILTYCMGAIVTKDWIITAANCVNKQSIKEQKTEVAYGVPSAFKLNNNTKIKVKEGKQHPYFDPDSIQKSSHNVGLLKLEKELDLKAGAPQSSVFFQKGHFFVQRCMSALIPIWRKRDEVSNRKLVVPKNESGDLECITVEVMSAARCEGYDELTIDAPNSLCSENENNIMRSADMGAPLLCKGRTRPVIIGIFSMVEHDSWAVYTKIDQYFKFISEETGLKLPYMSEPTLSAKNCTQNILIYILFFFTLLY